MYKGEKRRGYMLALLPIILCVLLGVMLCIGFGAAQTPSYARADNEQIQYTNVLDDLSKDSTFNAKDYAEKKGDTSLKLLQVAESVNSELFIYVYCPNKISSDIGCNIRFNTRNDSADGMKDYTLRYINSDGVFSKWVVDGFTVQTGAVRYYNITQLDRKWDKDIDGDPKDEQGNIRKTKAYSVGQLWTVKTKGERIEYAMEYEDVVEITLKHVGCIDYDNGTDMKWFTDTSGRHDYTRSHYVAFKCNRQMDKLFEVDVKFMLLNYSYGNGIVPDEEEKILTLTDSQTGGNNAHNWTKKQYKWNRIQKTSDFLNEVNLNDEVRSSVKGMDWVLRFYETTYNKPSMTDKAWFYSEVNDVTILRLKFETDGVTYNLGVVDNLQTGTNTPDGTPNPDSAIGVGGLIFGKNSGWHWYTYLILIAAIVLGLPLLVFVVWLVVKLICWIIGLFKGA